jgi:hypothetical protein
VMAYLVCDNVRLCEIATRAEASMQLIEKSEIEIDLPVGGTIERSRCGLPSSACGRCDVAIEHSLGSLILEPFLPEDLGPRILRVLHHEAGEFGQLRFFLRLLDRAGRCLNRRCWTAASRAVEEGE